MVRQGLLKDQQLSAELAPTAEICLHLITTSLVAVIAPVLGLGVDNETSIAIS